jgi:hypothetical protein
MRNKPLLRLLAAAVFAWAAFTHGETIARAQAQDCSSFDQFCFSQGGQSQIYSCDYYPDVNNFFCTDCCYQMGGGFCENCWLF